MSQTGRGVHTGHMSGIHVGKDYPTLYLGATLTDGTVIQPRLKVRAGINANGPKGGTQWFTFTFWGKLAWIAAKSLSPGKEFSCSYRIKSYMSKVYDKYTGALILNSKNEPLEIEKVGLTVDEVSFGDESEKFGLLEEEKKRRAHGWNIPGHPANIQFKADLKALASVEYDGVSPTFVYATIRTYDGKLLGQQAATAPATQPVNTAAVAAAVNNMQAAVAAGQALPAAAGAAAARNVFGQ